MTDREALGKLIRAERDKRGLSQELLADLAGISRTHIGEIERGEVNVSFNVLESIANSIGLMCSDLVRSYEEVRCDKTNENACSSG